jgi:hypothetical protein
MNEELAITGDVHRPKHRVVSSDVTTMDTERIIHLVHNATTPDTGAWCLLVIQL